MIRENSMRMSIYQELWKHNYLNENLKLSEKQIKTM